MSKERQDQLPVRGKTGTGALASQDRAGQGVKPGSGGSASLWDSPDGLSRGHLRAARQDGW